MGNAVGDCRTPVQILAVLNLAVLQLGRGTPEAAGKAIEILKQHNLFDKPDTTLHQHER